MKKYNICEQCDLLTDDCDEETKGCFFPVVCDEKLVCPYCGHKIDDLFELTEIGLIGDGSVSCSFPCNECKNTMDILSEARYEITASPAEEAAVMRLGRRKEV
jgi:DNA-directed RNA polymerase subunit RPC12/RpoP